MKNENNRSGEKPSGNMSKKVSNKVSKKLSKKASKKMSTGSASDVLRVKRVRSAIRRPARQKATLHALGLGRMNRVRELPDTPSVRGMIAKVAHLVSMEETEA